MAISKYLKEKMEDLSKVKSNIDGKPFKKWFSNSKVVDKKGNPKVMYHGTPHSFKVFRTTSEMGIHVGDLEAAKAINDIKSGNLIMSLYVRLENPLRMKDVLIFEPNETIPVFELMSSVKLSKESVSRMRAAYDSAISLEITDAQSIKDSEKAMWAVQDLIIKEIKDNGYDGIVYKNQREGKSESYILFDKNQVKSIYNEGTWSLESNNIDK